MVTGLAQQLSIRQSTDVQGHVQIWCLATVRRLKMLIGSLRVSEYGRLHDDFGYIDQEKIVLSFEFDNDNLTTPCFRLYTIIYVAESCYVSRNFAI